MLKEDFPQRSDSAGNETEPRGLIQSVRISPQGSLKGEKFVKPNPKAQSYRINRGRFQVYSDGSGKYPVPPEWREKGVTIVYQRMGGASEDSYVDYQFLVGDNLPPEE